MALGEKGVKTLDDLGDLASDELIEIVGADKMDEATANEVIMMARAHWFDGEEARPRRRRLVTTEPDPASPIADPLAPTTEDAEPETGPLRRCIVTRERLPKERMIRFVVGPDRQIVPDLAARLPGRGIWLSASADVLKSGDAHEAKTTRRRAAKEKQGDGTQSPPCSRICQGRTRPRIGAI